MTVTSSSLKFNKATAVELNYAPYIRIFVNAKTRQIAIQPCSEKDPNAIKFSNEESKQNYAISIGDFTSRIGACQIHVKLCDLLGYESVS